MGKVCVPSNVSYFKFNRDGTFRNSYPGNNYVYIDERQFGCLMDKDTVVKLFDKYGGNVAVMHRKRRLAALPLDNPRMFLLGK